MPDHFYPGHGKMPGGGRLSTETQTCTTPMHVADQKLLSRLLDEHGAALVLYAQQWCDGPEDVVQEAFIQLMRQQPLPRNEVGWLYRVVRNGAISQSRSQGRRSRHEAAAGAARQAWFKSTEDDALDGASAAAALELLPIHEREVIVLRLWSEMSFEEIGELIGKSTSTAHRWYETGLNALREHWSNPCISRRAA
jgi:RNA polymerase sigma factor (sigma-70 family)